MRYEINGTKVSIFQDEESLPFWYQETFPNGDEFIDETEAETWAIAAINSLDESSEYQFPIGRDIPREKKIDVEARIAKLSEIKSSK